VGSSIGKGGFAKLVISIFQGGPESLHLLDGRYHLSFFVTWSTGNKKNLLRWLWSYPSCPAAVEMAFPFLLGDQLLLLDQQNHYHNNPLLLEKLQPLPSHMVSWSYGQGG